jgi:hypothetical protein
MTFAKPVFEVLLRKEAHAQIWVEMLTITPVAVFSA